MNKPKRSKHFRFGQIEWYSRDCFFLAIWCGRFEMQFNRWPKG